MFKLAVDHLEMREFESGRDRAADQRPGAQRPCRLPGPGGREALQRGKNGLYSDQARDGYRTNVWRETPEAPIRDRTFLARLLEDLSKVWHSTGVIGHEKLRRQGRAVLAWQARVKGGRNLH